MGALLLPKIDYNILVVGPIYDDIGKIEKIINLISNYELIIINGGLCHPKIKNIEKNFEFNMKNIFSSNKIIYNLGADDLIFGCANKKHQITKWINNQPNVIFLEFNNQTNIIITNGGLTTLMKKNDLMNNIETTFVSNIDNVPWHKKYNGMYGYVISNNPLTLEKPSFYPYSLQMGNKYECNYQTYAQEVESKGLKHTILL